LTTHHTARCRPDQNNGWTCSATPSGEGEQSTPVCLSGSTRTAMSLGGPCLPRPSNRRTQPSTRGSVRRWALTSGARPWSVVSPCRRSRSIAPACRGQSCRCANRHGFGRVFSFSIGFSPQTGVEFEEASHRRGVRQAHLVPGPHRQIAILVGVRDENAAGLLVGLLGRWRQLMPLDEFLQ
jgi:hypothetical protein